MNETERLAMLARGEDSRHQLKENFGNVDSLAAELDRPEADNQGRIAQGDYSPSSRWSITPLKSTSSLISERLTKAINRQ